MGQGDYSIISICWVKIPPSISGNIWDSLRYFIIFTYSTFPRGTLTMFCGILVEKNRSAFNEPNDRCSVPGLDRHFYLRRDSGTN